MIQGECSWKIVEEPQCSAETPLPDEPIDSHATDSQAAELQAAELHATEDAQSAAEKPAARRLEEPKVLQLEAYPKDEPQCPIDFPMEDDWFCDNTEDRFQVQCSR